MSLSGLEKKDGQCGRNVVMKETVIKGTSERLTASRSCRAALNSGFQKIFVPSPPSPHSETLIWSVESPSIRNSQKHSR